MQQGNKMMLVLGILVIVAGVLIYFEASSFQKKAVLTDGKIVHVLGSSYRIQYFTNEGTEKIKYGSGKTHGFHEGDALKVWYRVDNPDKARISDGKKGSKKLFIGGILCILLGVYPLFLKKK